MAAILAILGGLASLATVLTVVVTVFRWWRKRAGRRRDAGCPDPAPYVRAQQETLGRWRVLGIERDIVLEHIFVSEVLQSSSAKGPLGLSPIAPTGDPPVEDAVLRSRLIGKNRGDDRLWVLVGPAGSGKTTLLRHWTVELLKMPRLRRRWRRPRAPIAVYFALRHLSDGQPSFESIGELLALCLGRTCPQLDIGSTRRVFERLEVLREPPRPRWRRLFAGAQRLEWVLLLDGYDELDEQWRSPLLGWLEGLPVQARAVLTTRAAVSPSPSGVVGARVWELRDFEDRQIREFVNKWFVKTPSLGKELLDGLFAGEALDRLARIPLLLTCLCLDVEVRGQVTLPDRLQASDLLRRAVEILIDGWDASKAHRRADPRHIGFGIAVLAEVAVEHPYASAFSRVELAERARSLAETHGLSDTAAASLVERLLNSGRLLLPSRDDQLVFEHNEFFDFFYAEGLRRARQAQP